MISDMAASLTRNLGSALKMIKSPVLNQTNRSLSFSLTKFNDFKDELTAKQMANDNPFDSYVLKPEAGKGLLKSQPILVPSTKNSR